jgi:hypothetical protein
LRIKSSCRAKLIHAATPGDRAGDPRPIPTGSALVRVLRLAAYALPLRTLILAGAAIEEIAEAVSRVPAEHPASAQEAHAWLAVYESVSRGT